MSDETGLTALPSPCISVCQLDCDSGLCTGCYRTGAEIAAWRSMSPDAQRDLLDVLRDRRAAVTGIRRRPARSRLARSRQAEQGRS